MSAIRLILTTSDSGAGGLSQTGLADIVIPFGFRFVWGPLRSDAELVTSLSSGSPQHDGTIDHWLWNVYRKHVGVIGGTDIGLIDLCERCETIELWIDPDPNSQLTLIWLLDYLRQHAKIALKLTLVQADVAIGNHLPEEVATWRLPAVKILNDHLEPPAWPGRPTARRPRRTGSTCSARTSASCRSFGTACWNYSKNSPCTRRGSARRKCGCWS